jgi:acyl-CoA hydrolase
MSLSLEPKRVCDSQAERSEIVFPNDANPIGNLFGGRLMQFIDLVGAVASCKHAHAVTVTASMDHLDFVSPVKVGELLILKASVNRAFKTSMEVGVKAMVEDLLGSGRMRHVASAYLTYVAVDMMGKKLDVPPVLPETEHQKRRYEDALKRREMRSGEMLRRKEIRAALLPEWYV